MLDIKLKLTDIISTTEINDEDKIVITQNDKEVRRTTIKEILNKFTSENNVGLYIGETLPEVSNRNENTLYFKVTDTINTTANENIKISPTMGLKLV